MFLLKFLKKTIKHSFTINDSILNKIRIKRIAFKRFKKYKTKENQLLYARARNQVIWAIRKHKKLKEQSIAKNIKKNPKELFQYLNSKTKSKESIPNLEDKEGNVVESDSEKCEVMNKFFSSVFVNEDVSSVPTMANVPNFSTVSNVNISESDIIKALTSLNTSKSPGPDEIHPLLLKELAVVLAYPLLLLFNKTLKQGKIPNKWKNC